MKKRILTVTLVIALIATCFGGTLAYLKDTDAVKNTFTTGNVYISLDEAVVVKDEKTGNLVAKKDEQDEDVRTSDDQEYKLYPGMTVDKDPTIYVEGTEAAYVAAKITISGELTTLMIGGKGLVGEDGKLNVSALLSGGLLTSQEGCIIEQVVGTGTWTLYVYMNDPQAVGTEIKLFETLTVPAEWDNAEMALIDTLEINVQAFATQSNGFGDCKTAITTAFDDKF